MKKGVSERKKKYGYVWGWRGALWHLQFHISTYMINKYVLQLCKKATRIVLSLILALEINSSA